MLTQITNTPLIIERSNFQFRWKIFFSSNQKKDKQYLGSNDNKVEGFFNSLRSRSYNIWSIDLNGSNLTQLTELDAWDQLPYSDENGLYFFWKRQ